MLALIEAMGTYKSSPICLDYCVLIMIYKFILRCLILK